ncbi:MAG: histidine phosphatase family protein [Lachnospiraceae bacterium]
MTRVYFVRHAQPEHTWQEDRTRPLTEEGKRDSAIVLDFFKDKEIDAFYCSPYKRSVDTIADTAAFFRKKIITDEDLREREKGPGGNNHGMFQKRWADHDYHEDGGESIAMVQKRNMEALNRILSDNPDKVIVVGTHGTALSAILNYYDNSFCCEDFLRIIDWMPYIIELDFEGNKLVGKCEHCHVEKEFKGNQRADKLNGCISPKATL